MMNNAPIILNEVGAAILAFEEDFFQEMKKQGIRNPHKVRMDIYRERRENLPHGGFKINPPTEDQKAREPKKEEYDSWKNLHDKFIADKIFEEFGYGTVRKAPDWISQFAKDYIPCEGYGGQCDFDCLMRGDCKYK